MSEDANIWQIIRDLGVFVSVLAAAIGYWVRIRSEQKKVIKRVLFHLLEIRYKARFLAPPSKESIKAFTQRYYASLNDKQIDLEKEIPEEVLQAVIEHVIALEDLRLLSESEELECKLAAGRDGKGQLPDTPNHKRQAYTKGPKA